jgi:hypothetical protein
VKDVLTASCVFCPYGADVKPGDRAYAFDEKTNLGRQQRDRLVEVTAVKSFRSTGRLVTIDLIIARESELMAIAEDSEIPLQTLYDHRSGNATYIDERPGVVVYFKPCKEDDTVAERSRQAVRQEAGGKPIYIRRGRKY